MKITYRMSKDDGTVSTIERWKAEARLTGNYADEKAALAAATKDAPVETIGALYWTEIDGEGE